jgi:hypothetical protein
MAPEAGAANSSAGSGQAHGWWKAHLETVPGGYLDLIVAEEDASRIIHFHPIFVPGLLQTEEYARAITATTLLKPMGAGDAAELVNVRMLRQRFAIHGERYKEMVFILDEASLRRPVGSPDTMRDQLTHLLGLLGNARVTLVVVPFEEQPHPGLLGAFTLLEYTTGVDAVLCFEWQLGNTVIRDRPDLVRRYRALANRLVDADPDGASAKRSISSALAATRESCAEWR